MRLDHVSYVAAHDQISDVVNRIGSQIGTAFVDGGIHPKFGTRNFTAPLLNEQYIEIVCPLDHPATDATPFGQAVKKKADAGGGWLAWVISTNDISKAEKHFGRHSIAGYRKKPNGDHLEWNQIGVLSVIQNSEQPFFINWISGAHPSKDGQAFASIEKININTDRIVIKDLIEFINPVQEAEIMQKVQLLHNSSEETGIIAVDFNLKGKIVEIF
jgi:hypothetical protein